MLRYMSVLGAITATMGTIVIIINQENFWRGCVIFGIGALTTLIAEWIPE